MVPVGEVIELLERLYVVMRRHVSDSPERRVMGDEVNSILRGD